MENLVNLQQLSPYYHNKKVFITGHTGFKGAWLMAWLHLLGARIKGYALEPEYEQSLFNLLWPLNDVESVIADIRDRKRLTEELLSFQPDYIFHLAAQPLVRKSYLIPAETFEINVTGTANLLQAAEELQGKCSIIVITTDKVYDNKEKDILYREEDALGGYDPYSASKACTELVINAFRNSFFNTAQGAGHKKALASVRAGNVIGGGDWNTDRIVPDIVRALQMNQVIGVRNPGAVRPWQHVLEPLAGYLLLGGLMASEPANFSRAYNLGPLPHDHLTVQQLVEAAIEAWGTGSWKDLSGQQQPHEAHLLKLDITRAMAELKWEPKLNSTTAVKWTMDWYRKQVKEQAAFTFHQIKEYLAL